MKKSTPTLIQYGMISIVILEILFLIMIYGELYILETYSQILLWTSLIVTILALFILKWTASLRGEHKKNKLLLEESTQLYKTLIENTPNSFITFSLEGVFISTNVNTIKVSGFTSQELLGKSFTPFVIPSEREKVWEHFKKAAAGQIQEFTTTITHKNGQLVHIHATNFPMFQEGQITGAYAIIRDISENLKIAQFLDESREHYNSLFHYNLDIVFLINPEGRFTNINPAGEKLLGFTKAEAQQKSFHDVVVPTDLEKISTLFVKTLEGAPQEFEVGVISKKEHIIQFSVTVAPIIVNREAIGIIGIAKNITDEKQTEMLLDTQNNILERIAKGDPLSSILDHISEIIALQPVASSEKNRSLINKAGSLTKLAIEKKQQEDTIRYMAYHDTVTGLGNRSMFYEEIDKALKQPNINNSLHAIIYMDLDRFKLVNDSLGHAAGDKLLVNVASRLLLFKDSSSVAVRIGGDEFALLIKDTSYTKIEQITTSLLEELRKPYTLQKTDYFVTASIGVSFFPTHGKDRSTLIKKADAAMLHAKNEGKNNYYIYHEEMNKKSEEELFIEMYLKKAIDLDEFVLHYQPIVNVRSAEIVGVEALIRWNHPKLGFIRPHKFIPIAERTGYIVPIGEWVMYQSCKQGREWQESGLQLPVSVNISVYQFQRHNFIEMIEQVLLETGLHPDYLQLEITESIMMDTEEAMEKLQRLRKIGIRIAIDDFGTGYSSLSVLKDLPIDRLKIDRSFFSSSNMNNTSIVKSILAMAHNLNMTVTAEGVETEEQVHFLKALECDYAQGYYYSKPKQAKDLIIHPGGSYYK